MIELPADLEAELKRLAANRRMTLYSYIVEKLWAIVQMNRIRGPED